MYFKKSVCALLSMLMMTGGGFASYSGVHALQTKRILDYLQPEEQPECEQLTRIVKRTRDFIRLERKKHLRFYDNAKERADSLAFDFFCFLCLREDNEEINALVDKAIGMRSVAENNEDIVVIDYIFPQNTDEFALRFGLKLEEDIRAELSRRIHQWRYDPANTMRMYRYRASDVDRAYLTRKPEREIQDTIREGLREYLEARDKEREYHPDYSHIPGYYESDTDTTDDSNSD